MMSTPPRRRSTASWLAVPLAALAMAAAPLPAQSTAGARHDYTQADVDFMRGMIVHHAQAVVMSEWAATHGARPDLQTLCKRIALSQRDEIATMQHWLRARGLAAPDPLHTPHDHPAPAHDSAAMDMGDMGGHSMMMPGMLTPAEMRALDAARDTAFDRLYLTGMIKHHQGALDMVAKLYATPGGGQQSEVSALAIDVDAGQRAEMARMQAMLNTLTASQNK